MWMFLKYISTVTNEIADWIGHDAARGKTKCINACKKGAAAYTPRKQP